MFPGHSDNSGEHGPVPRVPPDRQGSDAYITHDGLMQAMVSTFNSEDLKMRRRAQIKLGEPHASILRAAGSSVGSTEATSATALISERFAVLCWSGAWSSRPRAHSALITRCANAHSQRPGTLEVQKMFG